MYDVQEVKAEQHLANDDGVERWLATRAGDKPFLLVNIKREAYDCYDKGRAQYLNYDLIIPLFGDNPHPVECLSGAERTRSLTDFRERMAALNYPEIYFASFFELFKAAKGVDERITCAGAGFGVERLTYGILGLPEIHDVYPFPRCPREG